MTPNHVLAGVALWEGYRGLCWESVPPVGEFWVPITFESIIAFLTLVSLLGNVWPPIGAVAGTATVAWLALTGFILLCVLVSTLLLWRKCVHSEVICSRLWDTLGKQLTVKEIGHDWLCKWWHGFELFPDSRLTAQLLANTAQSQFIGCHCQCFHFKLLIPLAAVIIH